ncbi:MAG: hypothetical protein IPN17_11225 [Deltaproteobacteria bacterium]|nr:hypothetical protein [Deltaproteobacteria bacterium]
MLALLQDRAALFGLTSARSLSLVRVERQRSGDYLVELRQTVNGVPVTRDGLLVIIDASGFVRSITGAVLPERAWPPTIPLVGRAQARLAAGGTERATESLQVYDPETGTTEGDEGLLAWLVEGGERSESAYVDAISGRVIARFSAASGATHREVLDAEDAPPFRVEPRFSARWSTTTSAIRRRPATCARASTSCSGGSVSPTRLRRRHPGLRTPSIFGARWVNSTTTGCHASGETAGMTTAAATRRCFRPAR